MKSPTCSDQLVNSPRLKSGLILLLGTGIFSMLFIGGVQAWNGRDLDLQSRQAEYSCYAGHVYPNKRLDQPDKAPATAHTVYPPYAFPFMSIFFGAGSFVVARVILQVATLGALAAISWHTARVLSFAGPQMAALGTIGVLAFAGNRAAIAWGQFSILCMGFLTLQAVLLERKRPVLAGLCWAIGMLKPHIGMPFALLFVMRREWTGLLTGVGLLLVLTAKAFWWTSLHPMDYLRAAVFSEKLKFTADAITTTFWMRYLHIPPFVLTAVALGLVLAVGVVVAVRNMPKVRSWSLFPDGAGLCAVLGYVLFYHRYYDDMMLYPLLLAMGQRLLKGQLRPWGVFTTLLLAFVLCVHWTVFGLLPVSAVLTSAFAIAAAVFLLRTPPREVSLRV